MKISRLPWHACNAVLALWIFLLVQQAQSLSQEYCSNQNTGSNYDGTSDTFQSNGNCQQQCQSQYAFAVLQGNMCWCSNYVPGNQVDVGSCNQNCPGYPQEQCGSTGSGLFGYVALTKSPSGTAGAASGPSSTQQASSQQSSQPTRSPSPSPTSPSSPPPTSTVPVTIVLTSTEPGSVITSVVTSAASTQNSNTSPSPSSTNSHAPSPSATSSPIPTPVTSTQVVTIGGGIVTNTVTSTPSMGLDSGSSPIQPIKIEGLSGGATAGVAVGSVMGVALLALIGIGIFWWRRRRSHTGATDPESPHRSPRRNTSVLSRTGLLSSEREKSELPQLTLNTNARRSSTLLDTSTTTPASQRRNSHPLIYDQRLNPSALMANENGSRTSVATMQDNRDYTRPLNVMNPDPPGENRPAGSSRS